MTKTESLASVLAHHGIDVVGKSDDTLTDDARAAGIIFACLGCGSVGGIDPEVVGNHASVEDARIATRDCVDHSAWECCGDTIIF